MIESEKKFGDLGIIENGSEMPHSSERPVEIDSWEALAQHGEIIIERVHAWNTKMQKDTNDEFNQVIASSRLPQDEIFKARHEFAPDGKLKEGFRKMDLLAANTTREIAVVATVH